MQSQVDGLLVLDKPKGMTSRAVVDRVQRCFPRKTRVGHTGTLDPLATGVLVVCVGVATRLTEYVQSLEKTYLCKIRLGARSNTDDGEGEIIETESVVTPKAEELFAAVEEFVGEIDQVPPAFSAARVTGKRAYELARAAKTIELKARKVRIYSFEVLDYRFPTVDVRIRCSKGTYIRSLARDLGERLGCGGFVDELRRTKVGSFDEHDAHAIDLDATSARAFLLPIERAVTDLPDLTITSDQAAELQCGRTIPAPADLPPGDEIAVFYPTASLLAVVVFDQAEMVLRPHKVLRR